MIRASGFREIGDLLRLVPGVFVSSTNTGQPAVAFHGFGEEYNLGIQVLVDGRRIASPVRYGGASFSALGVSIDDIERIEVFRGANSAAFGTNATRGLVNIITRAPRESQGFALLAAAGTDGIRDEFLRFGGAHRDGTYRLTIGRRRDNGFADISDDMRVNTIDFLGDLALGRRSSLSLSAGGVTDGSGTGAKTPTNPRVEVNRQDFRVIGQRAEVALVVLNQESRYQDYRLNYWFERRAFVTLRVNFD